MVRDANIQREPTGSAKKQVEFVCEHDRETIPGEGDLSRIKQRLAFLYKTDYSLALAENSIHLTLKQPES